MKSYGKLSVCILAGGASQRLGQNKALMPFLGKPLIQRVVERVTPIATEIIVIANEPGDYRFLKLPVVGDKISGAGALGGLFTALTVAVSPYVTVLACDLPFVNKELIQAELDLLLAEPADVVIPESDDGLEPLHAVYRREPCLVHVQQALVDNQKRLISWFSHVRIRVMTLMEVCKYDPNGTAFININIMADFVHAEKTARKQNQSDNRQR